MLQNEDMWAQGKEERGIQMNRQAKLFHRIAPVYRLFFKSQNRKYSRLIDKYGHHLPLGRKALDIGCGSGALSNALHNRGFEVTGVDFAPAMIELAQRLSPQVTFLDADGRQLPFPDKGFELVTAAYVVHGLNSESRLALYREAARLAQGMVLFHDYNQRRNPFVDIVELIEGGHYFSFLSTGLEEMQQVFADVSVIDVGPRSSWYICTP